MRGEPGPQLGVARHIDQGEELAERGVERLPVPHRLYRSGSLQQRDRVPADVRGDDARTAHGDVASGPVLPQRGRTPRRGPGRGPASGGRGSRTAVRAGPRLGRGRRVRMTDTTALAATHSHVDDAGAKLLLVGDQKQLAAVGAGGGMELLAGAGARYEHSDARRFTADWERAASLRLALAQHHAPARLPRRPATGRVRAGVLRCPTGRPPDGRNPMSRASIRPRSSQRLSPPLRSSRYGPRPTPRAVTQHEG